MERSADRRRADSFNTLGVIRGIQTNLRAVERTDAPALHVLLNEPSVQIGWGVSGVPISSHRIESDIEQWMSTELETGRPVGLIIETLDADFVGLLVVHVSPRFNQSMATISIAISTGEQVKGYGKDALVALIDALIDEWGIHRIQVYCEAANEGAIALYDAVGFTTDATKRRATYSNGNHSDQLVYSLLATDSRSTR